jgi:hypothetical protein
MAGRQQKQRRASVTSVTGQTPGAQKTESAKSRGVNLGDSNKKLAHGDWQECKIALLPND